MRSFASLMTRLVASGALVVACASAPPPAPPLPPPPLPSPPPRTMAPLPDSEPIAIGAPAESAPPPPDSPRPPRGPGGDRELAALQLGFQGCRVMGQRIDPRLSGRAVLAARLAANGDVVWAGAARVENLPRAVVTCLVDRVKNTRFAPRGGDGSEIVIPVDFTRSESPAPATPVKQAPPPGTLQL